MMPSAPGMALDDLPLDRPPAPGPPEPPARSGSPAVRWIAVGLAGVAAGALLMFWWMSRQQPAPPAPAPVAAEVPPQSNRPKRQPIDLPSLNDSDGLMRTLVGVLSRNPTLARLLATPGLVRAATLSVVQIGDGRTPDRPLRALRPASRLVIAGTQTGQIDPASFARWEASVAALTSISPTEAAQLYVNVKPLFDEAYIELGAGGGDFDAALVRAFDVLAATPTPAADPVLLRRPGYFEHEDPALRALQPVQKQFLLLSPEQRRRVLDWLRQFATALDLKVA